MQVSVEQLEGLERRVNIQVPADQIESEIAGRLKTLKGKVKLDGFRPGKVPLKVVKQMYEPQVRREVVGDMLDKSLRQALTDENLQPAGSPRIEPVQIDADKDLEYNAVFEVMPEIELADMSGISIDRPLADVGESDVDAMIETLRKQRTDWTEVLRASADGDRVTADFEGKIDGEEFPGNKGEGVPVVLGSGQMLKDFENALQSVEAGQSKEFELTFPADYHAAELQGKVAQFNATVNKVEEPKLPEVNEQFAKEFGIEEGTVEALRAALKENMERELNAAVKAGVKNQVMNRLIERNPVTVPAVMIKDEIARLAEQAGIKTEPGDDSMDEVKQNAFGTEAKRRVQLGLIIAKLVRDRKMQVDNSRVQAHVEQVASTYEDPAEVIQYFRSTQGAMEDIRAMVLEEQVVDSLLEQAQIADVASTFDAIMKPEKAPTASAAEQS